jgi:hypothetical protein
MTIATRSEDFAGERDGGLPFGFAQGKSRALTETIYQKA